MRRLPFDRLLPLMVSLLFFLPLAGLAAVTVDVSASPYYVSPQQYTINSYSSDANGYVTLTLARNHTFHVGDNITMTNFTHSDPDCWSFSCNYSRADRSFDITAIPAPNQITYLSDCRHANKSGTLTGKSVCITANQNTTRLQQAIDDVCANGGGTVNIPADVAPYDLIRPLFVANNSNDITIKGTGMATCLRASWGVSIPLVLGMQKDYGMTSALYPQLTGVFDTSVTATHYGLCTYDGSTVRASGYFPFSAFAYGSSTTETLGSNSTNCTPSYYSAETAWTLDLIVRNDESTANMSGTICGVGSGGPNADITDPRTIWTIEANTTHNGVQGTWFCFKTQTNDAAKTLATNYLLITTSALAPGVHRFSVQCDFGGTGNCRAWYSKDNAALSLCPSNQVNLGANAQRFMEMAYGAFRLGKTTESCFAGAPAQKWTFCGVATRNALKYHASNSPQTLADGTTTPSDNDRYFNCNGDGSTIAYLPLTEQPSAQETKTVVKTITGGATCDSTYFDTGFWLPNRATSAMSGTITLKDMAFDSGGYYGGTPVAVGEAGHVVLQNLVERSTLLYGVATMDCQVSPYIEINACTIGGIEAQVFAKSAKLLMRVVEGGPGVSGGVKLVGSWGTVDTMMENTGSFCRYLGKIYAGPASMPVNGPLLIKNISNDNESGLSDMQAFYYLEPSLNAGPGGNAIEILGITNGGVLPTNFTYFQLADPPFVASVPNARLRVAQIYHNGASIRSVALVNSTHWYGKIYDCSRYWPITFGFLEVPSGNPADCHIVTYSQDDNSLFGSTNCNGWKWYAGCHVLMCPTPGGNTGAVTEYRCTTTYNSTTTPDASKWATDTLQ